MNDIGGNLARTLSAWIAMLRTGDAGELATILDERVIWQGILPDQICRNRDEVLKLLARDPFRPPRLTRIEAQEMGDVVVVSVDGPDFPANDVFGADAPRSLVLTFRSGKVIRMESLASRDAAFELAAR